MTELKYNNILTKPNQRLIYLLLTIIRTPWKKKYFM